MTAHLKGDPFVEGFRLSVFTATWTVVDSYVTDENFDDAFVLANERDFSEESVMKVVPDAYQDGVNGWSYMAERNGRQGEIDLASTIQANVIYHLSSNIDAITAELHGRAKQGALGRLVGDLLMVRHLRDGNLAEAEELVDEGSHRHGVLLNYHALRGDIDAFNDLIEAAFKGKQPSEEFRRLLCSAVTQEHGFEVGKQTYEHQGFSGIQPTSYALGDLVETMPALEFADLVERELVDTPNLAFDKLLAIAQREQATGSPVDDLLARCEELNHEIPRDLPSGTPWPERSIGVWQLGSFLTTIGRLADAERVAKSLSGGSKTRKQLLALIADAHLALDNPHADIDQLKKARDSKELDDLLRDAQSPTASKSRLNEAFRFRRNPSARRGSSYEDNQKAIEIPRAAVRNPAASEALIGRALNGDDQTLRLCAAGNPSASKEQLKEAFSIPYLRPAVAGNPSATKSQIAEALNDEYTDVQTAAAGNPAVTPAHIDIALSHARKAEVRKAGAGNPAATAKQVESALSDPSADVRTAAAGNPSATEAQIELALNDRELIVRAAAAENTSATEAQIRSALASDDLVVRLGATRNPSIPDSLLEEAAADIDPAVRKAATTALEA